MVASNLNIGGFLSSSKTVCYTTGDIGLCKQWQIV